MIGKWTEKEENNSESSTNKMGLKTHRILPPEIFSCKINILRYPFTDQDAGNP